MKRSNRVGKGITSRFDDAIITKRTKSGHVTYVNGCPCGVCIERKRSIQDSNGGLSAPEVKVLLKKAGVVYCGRSVMQHLLAEATKKKKSQAAIPEEHVSML